MKKQVVTIILVVAMVLVLGAVALTVVSQLDSLASVFTKGADADPTAKWLYFSIAALLAVWVVLFILFQKIRRNAELFGFSRTDELTGIGNKKQARLGYENLNGTYRRTFCLAYTAFDVQKVVEKYGESWGSRLQKGAADILSAACGDYECAARIGEGEFVLAVCCRDGLQAQQRIHTLTDRLNQYENRTLLEEIAPFYSGVYLPEDNRVTFETALSNAKTGYRYACDSREDAYVCTKDVLIKEASRDRLREKLNNAIDAGEFALFLQLVYDVRQERFVGAEALSRWSNPEEGFLMPSYYISDMQTVGVIEKFDLYMFDKVCAQLEAWAGTEFAGLMISCNITRISISSPEFMNEIRAIAEKYTFDHEKLVLEITEDALIHDRESARRNILACREDGYRIAIDDFGAGHSSFGDISDYPIDHIKVDRQLVLKAETKRGTAVLHGLIELAHNLGIRVVCEGVETTLQRDVVTENGCDYIQGYYYSYVYSVEEGQKHYCESLAKAAQ